VTAKEITKTNTAYMQRRNAALHTHNSLKSERMEWADMVDTERIKSLPEHFIELE